MHVIKCPFMGFNLENPTPFISLKTVSTRKKELWKPYSGSWAALLCNKRSYISEVCRLILTWSLLTVIIVKCAFDGYECPGRKKMKLDIWVSRGSLLVVTLL